MVVDLDQAKEYLRVDTAYEDDLIGTLLTGATQTVRDVARLDEDRWALMDAGTDESGTYSDDEIAGWKAVVTVAILYALAYMYEHREDADHHALTITLRALLGPIREGVL